MAEDEDSEDDSEEERYRDLGRIYALDDDGPDQ